MTTASYDVDPSLLTGIQRATTKVLAEFHRVCKELSLDYVVYGGTAIGAVRHKGFIPWDDDADICMPREDYERFLAEAPALLGKEFCLLSSRTVPDYPQTYSVLGLVGTQFVSYPVRNRPFRMPIGVDLFPLDVMPQDDAAFRSQARATWLWGRLLFLRGTPSPGVTLPFPVGPAASLVMYGVHWGLRALRVTPRALQRRWERAARTFEGTDEPWLADYSTRDPKRWSMRRDELFPATDTPFEDITVKIPKDYDAILTRGYGAYMELPPEEERRDHKPYHVDFGSFGKEND